MNWEYKIVTAGFIDFDEDRIETQEEINNLGLQGWELVNAHVTCDYEKDEQKRKVVSGMYPVFFFKRTLE